MTLRRVVSTVPLAVLVAVLAHVAGFGADHTPGAAHAQSLLGSLGAGLGLAALGTLLMAALRTDLRDGRSGWQDRWLPLLLTLGGALGYVAIELAEGHAPLGGGLRTFAALVPAAALVAAVARFSTRMLRLSGAALAALVSTASRKLARGATTGVTTTPPVIGRKLSGARYGRAPPLLA